MIPGRATAEGTAQYFNSRRELGGWLEASGLHCSRIGLGGYRIGEFLPTQTGAVKAALLSGCNLIDTSTNYTDGASERVIGRALAELIQVGVVDRNQVILVTKIGYVQGEALELAKARLQQKQGFPDMVQYQDGCWHCIHPDYLAHQLDRSLKRLGVDCVDFVLLHNPEYFLMDTARTGSSKMLEALRTEYYERIQQAFEYLETQVSLGRVQGYGISSNTFAAASNRADKTSAQRVWEAARQVGLKLHGNAEKHAMRIFQLPLNIFESDAVLEPDSDTGTPVLEFAAKQGLGVLTNRPLNAFTQQQLVRLADFVPEPTESTLDALLEKIAALEGEFSRGIGPALGTGSGLRPDSLFRWAADLGQIKGLALGVDRWSQIEEQITVHVRALCDQIGSQVADEAWTRWREQYLAALEGAMQWLRRAARARSQKHSDEINTRLDPLLPDPWKKAPLSRKALGIAMYTPGVSCVLNGMRHPDYVHDSMETTKLPPLEEGIVRDVYKAFRQRA